MLGIIASMATMNSIHPELLITFAYDPTGLAAVELTENRIIGWFVDEAKAPVPFMVGLIPASGAADTTPVLSPQWAVWQDGSVYVADTLRGSLGEFCTWLATNNGARRLVGGAGLRALSREFQNWAAADPGLAAATTLDFGFLPVEGAPTVLMLLPVAVMLTLSLPAADGWAPGGDVTRTFGPGEVAMPVLLAGHNYLKAHGARVI